MDTATATSEPTEGPTATVWPPVYDPSALGNIRNLDSFIATMHEVNNYGGSPVERTLTFGTVKEPYAAYFINQYSSGVEKDYVIDGRTYILTDSGDWYIEEREIDFFNQADIDAFMRELAAAAFVGEEEYEGIPAYHFVLERTQTSEGAYMSEGEFYLAKEGNYVLYLRRWSGTSDTNYVQNTQTFSSINQLTEITLPAEMQDMPAAAEVPSELALPLPPDSVFLSMIRYESLSNIDNYWFTNPFAGEEEFLDYYRNLPETDGWTVSHIGYVTKHGTECAEGDVSHQCVIINKGNTQVVLLIDPLSNNSLKAQFDWSHIFAPIQ
jgi:hypothetical protein